MTSASLPPQQDFVSQFSGLKTLLQNGDDSAVIQLLNGFSDEDLRLQLPASANHCLMAYPLTFWCLLFKRTAVLDYLVARLSPSILNPRRESESADALSFAIKYNLHTMTDYLLDRYSSAFDLINGSDTSKWFKVAHKCGCQKSKESKHKEQGAPGPAELESYFDQLEKAHALEIRFSQGQFNEDSYQKIKAKLREKTIEQNNSLKLSIMLRYRKQSSAYAKDIAKYIEHCI